MRKKSGQMNIVLIALITGICLLTDSLLYIALPLYWKEVGLNSLVEVGVLLSVNRFIRIPLNPLAATLVKTIPLRISLILAIFLTILVNFGFFSLNGFLFWFILRCIWGFVWAILRLSGQLLVVRVSTDSNKGKLMGVYNGTYRLGSLVGMALGGILSFEFGLKLTCLVFACMCILAVPLVFLLSSTPLGLTQSSNKRGIALLKNASVQVSLVRGFIVSFLLQGVFASTVSYFLSKHYGEVVNINSLQLSSGVAAGLLIGMRWSWEPFLAPFIGDLSDRKWGRHSMLTMALIITGALYPLIDSELPLFFWIFIIVILLICSTILTTLTDALFSDMATGFESKTSLVTYYSIAVDLGAAFGPLLAYQFIGGGKYFLFFCAGLAIFLAWISQKQNTKQKEGAAITL